VRFDHRDLAGGLIALGFNFTRIPTQVLSLTPDYELAFAGYNATIRNHVRKARRRGVSVRQTVSEESISEYYRLHTRLARQQGGYAFIYPLKLFLELVEIRSIVRLFVAEYQGRVIGGGLFFRDGNSTLYWHGASDREYSHLYPSCAVIDEAIHWACESGSLYFNLGASEGLTSLDRFKSFWGARAELNWQFEWTNPFWACLSNSKRR
jgi:lipid II:glycine glycyltransferase (peptidoglycan interpeptide bridge formation enzyme)